MAQLSGGTTIAGYEAAHAGNMENLVNMSTRYTMTKSSKDSNGIYTRIAYYRPNGVIAMESVLNGGTSPKYSARYEAYYDESGNWMYTVWFSIAYDSDGDVASETITSIG